MIEQGIDAEGRKLIIKLYYREESLNSILFLKIFFSYFTMSP